MILSSVEEAKAESPLRCSLCHHDKLRVCQGDIKQGREALPPSPEVVHTLG